MMQGPMPEPNNFIVGRAREVEQFSKLVKDGTKHWLLNIYGPGGRGNTVGWRPNARICTIGIHSICFYRWHST